MGFFKKGGGGNADADAAAAGGSVPGNSDTSAHSSQPIFVRDSVAGGSVMNVESSRSSRRPPRSLVMGRPGKVKRALTDGEVASILDYAERYVNYKKDYE